MKTIQAVTAVRDQVREWQRGGGRVGFVPTMGNLHDGHLELVRRAREAADRVVVSIFVNPLQFGAGEDFSSYPRTLEDDAGYLRDEGVDLLYVPEVSTMYPRPQGEQTRVEVPGISDILCGASRPGHFVGVATVVCKLFNQVGPDLAVFGEKDFQQLMVIRRMAEDLDMAVEIVGHPTVRESDGLARSSRNGYLTAEERRIAPALYRALQWLAEELKRGRRDFADLEREASAKVQAAGLTNDYLSIRRARDLAEPDSSDRDLVALVAAYLGKARLIDNLRVVV